METLTRTGSWLALLAVLSAGCSGDPSVVSSVPVGPNALAFLDLPSDLLVGQELGSLRVRVSGASASGELSAVLLEDGREGESLGRFPVEGQIVTLRGIRLDRPGTDLRLRVRLGAASADSPPFAAVPAFDAVDVADTGEIVGLQALGVDNLGFPVEVTARTERLTRLAPMRPAADPAGNRVVAFGRGHAPEVMEAIGWTSGVDTVRVSLPDPAVIDVTVWTVHVQKEFAVQIVLEALAGAERIWAEERAGLVLGLVDFREASFDPDAPWFRERTADMAYLEALRRRIGHDRGRLNLYLVDRVEREGRRFAGIAELGGSASAISPAGWNAFTIAHEFGHNLGLEHVDREPGFEGGNLMSSESSSATYLTEGQIFRMQFSGESALHRSLERGRRVVAPDQALPLAFRIWADGSQAGARGALAPRRSVPVCGLP